MSKAKSQYINLVSGSNRIADNAERKYTPETRPVHLSGKPRRLFEDKLKGIPVLESGCKKRTPILDLKRFLKYLLSGLGVGLIVTGVVVLFDKREGV